ncbi:(Fe-S)-binding protein [Bacillus aquiflavi]|uniref:Glycolate oxidase iron-sulfur subunit n=1 Tax=Bacillus aquiflavi TaxID=2672567 RepID=A0A6B3VTL8_9BACI|nr:(Fe-S)-binding protein [Bacillus aquiflavi]MBA4537353.1 (Fe-S)-binding protein [Bacillus aquiflavi]NEY81610.1 (Fe-S)-binding protein [Bacillus aquiflavi]UAC49179.1 (Fe-S)-binding protein [Bacillus aquiflavi]
MTANKVQQQFRERLNEDELLNCMRCGFCLPSCPTYIESGYQETHSPRGRIALMKAVVDDMIELDDEVERSFNLCLGCRACEPVCPSGVKYGHLLEDVRDVIQQNKQHSLPIQTIRHTVFKSLFPHKNRLRKVTGLLGFYQRSGLQTITRKIGFLKLFPKSLVAMEKVLPQVPEMKKMKNRPEFLSSKGEKKKRVAFFSGCLMDTLFLDTNNATMKLLQFAGCEIVIPKAQTCCGALHGHSGEKEHAKQLAKQNIEAFENLQIDYIITNAGGCSGFLIEYDHLLKNEPEWQKRAKAFTTKLKDISEILIDLQFHNTYELSLAEQTVTYQDSCHLKNVMKTTNSPRQLLQSIQGIHYQEMQDADHCCGSAGIYNIVEAEMSMKILDSKMKNCLLTKATTIVTANPGCLLQMKLGVEREGLSHQIRVVHIADLLLEALNEQD